jgi:peroxiredoxin
MDSFRDSTLIVVVFMSDRCPGVKAYDARLRRLHEEYGQRGVQFVGINPIDERLYPTESLSEMARAAKERGISFPYLKDTRQRLARQFGAVCTPQAFVLDKTRSIKYAGKIDDSFVEANARKSYLKDALDRLLTDRPVLIPETMPLGCTIDRSYLDDDIDPRQVGTRHTSNASNH